MSVNETVVDTLLKDITHPMAYRKIRETTYPNETVYQYEVSFQDLLTSQVAVFAVFISMYKEKVLGYKIFDALGNQLPVIDDRALEPYFYIVDDREYVADYSKVAIRFGRIYWN